MELLTNSVWKHISKAARAAKSNSDVAVAYWGGGGSKLLPLLRGSTVVVDMSLSAVRSGQTNPSDLLRLMKRGVDVHSVANLHAKVLVCGKTAFVGSANASSHSAGCLLEAC